MIQRFSSAKDSRTARKSNVGLVIAEVVVCALIIGLVTCAIPLYPTNDSAGYHFIPAGSTEASYGFRRYRNGCLHEFCYYYG